MFLILDARIQFPVNIYSAHLNGKVRIVTSYDVAHYVNGVSFVSLKSQ